MKFKGTLVLALLAVALGLYVYFIEIKKAAKDEEQKSVDEKVIPFEPSKVKAIAIKNAKGEIALEKGEGNSWKLTKPVSDQADDSAVTTLLNDISTEKFEQTIEGEDLKGFGLDNPVDTLALTFQDGSVKKVNVGTDAAISGKVYLLRDGEKKVLYANSGFKFQVERAAKDYRDKRLFKKNKDDVVHITLKTDTKDVKGQVSLTKKDGVWKIDGQDGRADTDVVNSVLSGIENMKATDFPSETAKDKAVQKKYGVDKPAVDVVLEGKDSTPLGHIVFSGPLTKENNAVFATSDGETKLFQLYNGATTTLIKKPQDFRDKKLPLEFKKDDVADVLVKNSLAEVHLTKKGNSWELPLPDPTKDVSQIQVANLLDKISNLKVAEYLEKEKPVGLNTPVGHIVLKNSKGDELLDFSWGERSKNKRNYYAKSSLYKGAFTVEGTALEGVPVQTLVETKAAPSPAAPASASVPAKSGPGH